MTFASLNLGLVELDTNKISYLSSVSIPVLISSLAFIVCLTFKEFILLILNIGVI